MNKRQEYLISSNLWPAALFKNYMIQWNPDKCTSIRQENFVHLSGLCTYPGLALVHSSRPDFLVFTAGCSGFQFSDRYLELWAFFSRFLSLARIAVRSDRMHSYNRMHRSLHNLLYRPRTLSDTWMDYVFVHLSGYNCIQKLHTGLAKHVHLSGLHLSGPYSTIDRVHTRK